MSTQERQERTNDRTTTPNNRGRGGRGGRGGYPQSSRGRGAGHHKQQSYGSNTQYPGHNMYVPNMYPVVPGYAYPPQFPPQYPMPTTTAPRIGEPDLRLPQQPQQPFANKSPTAPRATLTENKAALVQKAETKKTGLDFKAMVAARIAAQKEGTASGGTAADPRVEPDTVVKPEEVPEAKPASVQVASETVETPKEQPQEQSKPTSSEEQPKVESKEAVTPKQEPNVATLNLKERIAARIAAANAQKEADAAAQAAATEAKPEPVPVATETKSETVTPVDNTDREASKPPSNVESTGEESKESQNEESKVEDTPSAPQSETTDAETSTAQADTTADRSTATEVDGVSHEPSAEPEEKENTEEPDESFAERVKVAAKITSPKDQQYPQGFFSTTHEGLVYENDFLKQFQTVVPAINRRSLREIVNVEAQKGSGRTMSNRSNRMGSMQRDGGRNMSRHGSMASMHGKGGRNNSRRKGDRQGSSRREKEEPAAPVAPLVRGENAWVPRTLKVSDDGKVEAAAPVEEPKEDLMPAEEVERRIKSLLNKMSLDNMDRISKKIIDIANQSRYESDARTLHQIIELTFDKACDEPHWSAMYAKFCVELHNIDDEITDVNTVDREGNAVSGQRLFRRFLLSRCQKEFEQGWSNLTTESDALDVMSDAYYAAVKAKRHGLGLVRFVGELFKAGFLSSKIIGSCVHKLASESPTEEIVESMCKLITTIAPRVQSENPETLAYAMETIQGWRGTAGFPSRLRFMIMDVEDAHRNGWKIEDKGPKTLAEVHKEVAEEQASAENEKRSKGGFGSMRRPNERDTHRRMEKERSRLASTMGHQSSRRTTPAADAPLTPSGSSTDLKKESQGNMFSQLS